MAKKNENPSPIEGEEPIVETLEKIDLQNYLDSLYLTRAERTYYERTYSSTQVLKTYKEWESEIKIVH